MMQGVDRAGDGITKKFQSDSSTALTEVPKATISAQNEKGRGREQIYKGDVEGPGSTEQPFET